MNYFKLKENLLISEYDFPYDKFINFKDYKGIIYYLAKLPLPSKLKFSAVSYNDLLIDKEEIENILTDNRISKDEFINENISKENISVINTNYPNWERALTGNKIEKWKVNLIGLGDVGGTLLTGLRLLGGDVIDKIGIYDLDEKKINRWFYEGNQIVSLNDTSYPEIIKLKKDEIFNCDAFIFCVTLGIPTLDSTIKDVRMAQYEKNSKIIKSYCEKGREKGFNGLFAVVSDPVDLLCYSAFEAFNQDCNGKFDYLGIPAENIKGYGLGVMNGRASFYGGENYLKEGRVFGPHGKGLIVVNSIDNYNEKLSDYLTDKTTNCNLEVREFGYKPYIAPALSSAAISIIDTLRGKYNYSNVFIDNAFFGIKNKITKSGVQTEKINYNSLIFNKIIETHKYIKSFSK
ncbi:MAG: lactate dehydrogenase [Clostridiaceae bacterium]